MLKVAITGGIGSGKTTVANIIESKGYKVLSCDKIAREVLLRQSILRKLKKDFKPAIKGLIYLRADRKKLAGIAFANRKKLDVLNKVTHPVIMQNLQKQINKSQENIVFAEVPLLFESNYEKMFDEVIIVMRGLTERIDSVIKRSNISVEEIKDRIKNQYDYEKIDKNEHTIIYNNCSLKELEIEVDKVLNEIQIKTV